LTRSRFFFQKKKIQFSYFFLIKTEPNRKWSSLIIRDILKLWVCLIMEDKYFSRMIFETYSLYVF
jgi:hypothetical protein